VAARYLTPENRSTGIISNSEHAAELEKLEVDINKL
jgi:hypothetical protein